MQRDERHGGLRGPAPPGVPRHRERLARAGDADVEQAQSLGGVVLARLQRGRPLVVDEEIGIFVESLQLRQHLRFQVEPIAHEPRFRDEAVLRQRGGEVVVVDRQQVYLVPLQPFRLVDRRDDDLAFVFVGIEAGVFVAEAEKLALVFGDDGQFLRQLRQPPFGMRVGGLPQHHGELVSNRQVGRRGKEVLRQREDDLVDRQRRRPLPTLH